jgi:hypothetical protein
MGINKILFGRLFVRLFFAWYDLWIGAYWDRERRMLYLCPVPCFGIALKVFPKFDLINENVEAVGKE